VFIAYPGGQLSICPAASFGFHQQGACAKRFRRSRNRRWTCGRGVRSAANKQLSKAAKLLVPATQSSPVCRLAVDRELSQFFRHTRPIIL
jgi:hypothetical protein